jgi:hypothetical protein
MMYASGGLGIKTTYFMMLQNVRSSARPLALKSYAIVYRKEIHNAVKLKFL